MLYLFDGIWCEDLQRISRPLLYYVCVYYKYLWSCRIYEIISSRLVTNVMESILGLQTFVL